MSLAKMLNTLIQYASYMYTYVCICICICRCSYLYVYTCFHTNIYLYI